MTTINLVDADLQAKEAQVQKLNEEINAQKKKNKKSVIDQLRAAMAAYDITADELGGRAPRVAKAPSAPRADAMIRVGGGKGKPSTWYPGKNRALPLGPKIVTLATSEASLMASGAVTGAGKAYFATPEGVKDLAWLMDKAAKERAAK